MDKLGIYEVLSGIVPGTLLLGGLAILLPDDVKVVSSMAVLAHAADAATTDRSLFLYAMQPAEVVADSKVKSFKFAYYRVLQTLATLLLAFVVAWLCNVLNHINRGRATTIMLALVGLGMLLWYRTRHRAYYYVREVLFATERLLVQPSTTK